MIPNLQNSLQFLPYQTSPSPSGKPPLPQHSGLTVLILLLLLQFLILNLYSVPFTFTSLGILIIFETEISKSSTSLIRKFFWASPDFPVSCKCLSSTFKLNITKTQSTVFPLFNNCCSNAVEQQLITVIISVVLAEDVTATFNFLFTSVLQYAPDTLTSCLLLNVQITGSGHVAALLNSFPIVHLEIFTREHWLWSQRILFWILFSSLLCRW